MAARHLSSPLTPRKALSIAAGMVVLAVWFLILRPSVLGGPATYSIVSGHSMEPTYQPGDYVIALAQDEYSEGDIVMFEVSGGRVIHRIVGGSADAGFVTRGDNNAGIDPWQPSPDSILGEAWVHVPGMGEVIAVIRGPLGIGVMAGMLTTGMFVMSTTSRGRHRKRTSPMAGPAIKAILGSIVVTAAFVVLASASTLVVNGGTVQGSAFPVTELMTPTPETTTTASPEKVETTTTSTTTTIQPTSTTTVSSKTTTTTVPITTTTGRFARVTTTTIPSSK